MACEVRVGPARADVQLPPVRAACRRDILDVITRAGSPLPFHSVVRALTKAGKVHGLSTVTKALADLTAGALENPRDRRGYRLPG